MNRSGPVLQPMTFSAKTAVKCSLVMARSSRPTDGSGHSLNHGLRLDQLDQGCVYARKLFRGRVNVSALY